MSRAGKLVAHSVAITFTLVAVLITAFFTFLVTFDWNRARPWVSDKISQAIARPFVIQGDLKVTWQEPTSEEGWRAWVPWPMFSASKIQIGNPAWAKRKDFATLDEINFQVKMLPLLARNIIIPAINLVNPSVDLERETYERNNWTFKRPETAAPSEWTLSLHDVAFTKGHVTYVDEVLRANLQATIDTLGKAIPFDAVMKRAAVSSKNASSPAVEASAAKIIKAVKAQRPLPSAKPAPEQTKYGVAVKVTGTYKGAPLSGEGKTGGVLALQDVSRPLPIQANVRFGDTHIGVVGTLTDPAQLAALDLRLQLSGTSMSHLYTLTGLTLPDTPPYRTDGHLVGQFKKTGNEFHYQNFNGRVGGSDLSGTFNYLSRKPRPLLTGSLVSHLLQFSDLAPLIGADSSASKARRGAANRQPSNKALPVEAFRTERWKSIDADVNFTGQRIIRKATLPINNLYTHLILKNGVLTLEPLRFGVAGGSLNSKVRLDGSAVPMRGQLDLMARNFQLKQLFPTFQIMKTSLGQVNGDAILAANGNSVAGLIGTSSGEVKVRMGEGRISGALLETAGLNVANIVLYKLFGDQDVKINCAATDFVVNNGLLETRLAAFDTDSALIIVKGKINLASEQMDLKVNPQSKGLRILSLRSPLYVKGTFKSPDVGIDMGVALMRGGAALALGLLAPPLAALVPLTALAPDQKAPCGSMLAQARQSPKVQGDKTIPHRIQHKKH